jgi:CubicO group peptidase (beta-lactamase class C family)
MLCPRPSSVGCHHNFEAAGYPMAEPTHSSDVLDFAQRVRERFGLPAVLIAILHQGKPTIATAIGCRNVETRLAADADTTFAIGSCSKAWTAAAAAALVGRKIIDWDVPVRRYLPELSLYDEWIAAHLTLRDVLAHRTGLSRAGLCEYGSDLSRSEAIMRIADVKPIAAFRDQVTYTNIGYVIAAEVMARAAEKPFEQILHQYLLNALGMDRTTCCPLWHLGHNLAMGHERVSGRSILVPPMDLDNLVGAGSICTNARDAVKWLEAQLSVSLAGRTHFADVGALGEMHKPQAVIRGGGPFVGYGLGWFVGFAPTGTILRHTGAIEGFCALTQIEPQAGYACLIAANCETLDQIPLHAICNFARQAFLGIPDRDWLTWAETSYERAETESRPPTPIAPDASWISPADLAGRYSHQGLGTVELTARDGRLTFQLERASIFDGALRRLNQTAFQRERTLVRDHPRTTEGARIDFLLDETKATAFDWSGAWFGTARFIRTTESGAGLQLNPTSER